MQYTAIIKDGGLFVPNVFSDLNDSGSHIVQIEVDIAKVREQLNTCDIKQTNTVITPKKQTKRPLKKDPKKPSVKQSVTPSSGLSSKQSPDMDTDIQHRHPIGELEGLNDSELSEIFKAYINNGQASEQISLENL